VIEEYLDEQAATPGHRGIPRQVLEQLLMNKYAHPWRAIIGLEQERNELA
jgi:hypothetical protein